MSPLTEMLRVSLLDAMAMVMVIVPLSLGSLLAGAALSCLSGTSRTSRPSFAKHQLVRC